MNRLQKKKTKLAMMLIILVFICYSFFSVNISYHSYAGLSRQSEQLSIQIDYTKTSNIWLNEKDNRIISALFSRFSRTNFLKRGRKSIHKINSYLPVLFKTGIISKFIYIRLLCLNDIIFISFWIIHYIHKADGKKKLSCNS